jgi:hypothetical protein
VRRSSGTHWVLVFTDDTDRTGVRETVRVVQSAGHYAVVFLAPDVLFESFRRELARMERVSAYEVGPGERLEAVLSGRRRG